MKKKFSLILIFLVLLSIFCINVSAEVDDQYTKSWLHFEGTDSSTSIIDEAGKTWVAHGNAKIKTDNKQVGNSALYCDGSGDYITTTSSDDFNYYNGDFTIEMWINPDAYPSSSFWTLYTKRNSGVGTYSGIEILLSSKGTIQLACGTTGTSWDLAFCTDITQTVKIGQWSHIAVVRNGNYITGYLNGIAGTPINVGNATLSSNTSMVCVGGDTDGWWFKGYIDDFKVSKGIARDTSLIPSPKNLTASAGDTKVNLSWNMVTSATNYTIKRSITPGGPYSTIATTSAITYPDSSVTNGTTYYYVISAVVNGTESPNSNEASATPTAPEIIGNPGILEITMTNGQIKEYDLSGAELLAFLNWYDGKSDGTGKAYYTITKKNNIKPFLSRKEYIAFDKISSFEVKEYTE